MWEGTAASETAAAIRRGLVGGLNGSLKNQPPRPIRAGQPPRNAHGSDRKWRVGVEATPEAACCRGLTRTKSNKQWEGHKHAALGQP